MKDTIKAPHRFVAEGKGFRLYTRGEKTDTTYGTMAAAKKAVLSMNGAWRSKHGKGADSAVITNPRRKYDESRDAAGYRKLSDLKRGEFFKRKTLPFNGYADQVASLYTGMDPRKLY